MSSRLTCLGVAIALLAGIPSNAGAQARGYVGFGGGMAFPLGTFGDAANTGYLGQFIAGITGPSGRLGGRIDGMLASHDYGPYTYRQIGVMGDVVFTPGAGSNVTPYLLGGLGLVNGKTTGTGSALGSSTKPAFNAGAGLTLWLSRRIWVFVEGRYVSVQTEGSSTNFVPLTVGIRWGGR